MKMSKNKLKQIIKEEVYKILKEALDLPGRPPERPIPGMGGEDFDVEDLSAMGIDSLIDARGESEELRKAKLEKLAAILRKAGDQTAPEEVVRVATLLAADEDAGATGVFEYFDLDPEKYFYYNPDKSYDFIWRMKAALDPLMGKGYGKSKFLNLASMAAVRILADLGTITREQYAELFDDIMKEKGF